MKVAHIVWSLKYGGIETMLVDIVNEQVKHCEVRVYIINDHYDKRLLQTIDPEVKVLLINRQPGSKNIIPLLKLNLSLLRFKPNVIHCHQGNLVKALWLSWRKVLTIHNTYCSSAYFRHYQRLFCISKAVKDYTTSQGFHNGIVVYNGVHPERIAVKEYSGSTSGGALKTVCLGRLHPDKGQRILIKALDNLVNSRHLINITCDLIGDGDGKVELEKMVAQCNLAEQIKFVGFRSREWIYSHLKDYDLLIMPSVSEGFGLTLAEACDAKLPVITSDLSGPLEVIAGGRLGIVFRHGDSMDLADKLYQFTINPIDQSVIEEAYLFSTTHFDVTKTAQQYIYQYKELLNTQKKVPNGNKGVCYPFGINTME